MDMNNVNIEEIVKQVLAGMAGTAPAASASAAPAAPAAAPALHNTSTLLIGMNSMKNLVGTEEI